MSDTPTYVSLPIDMPCPEPKWLWAMTMLSAWWPPLMAMLSSPVLIVLHARTPHVASSPSPGSIPSVFRAMYGDITRPWLFVQFDGVRMVTPQTMKPAPGAVHVPPGGVDDSLTLNFGAL